MIVSTIDAARTVPEVVMLVWMSHSLQENCSQRGKQWGREEMGEFDIHVTRLRAARAGYTLSDTLHHWQGSKTRIGDRTEKNIGHSGNLPVQLRLSLEEIG